MTALRFQTGWRHPTSLASLWVQSGRWWLNLWSLQNQLLKFYRWLQWICEVYTANFKGTFEVLESECVWQQARMCYSCYWLPKKVFSTHSYLLVSWQMMQRHLLSILPCNSCKCNSSGICITFKFYFYEIQLSLLYTVWTNAYSESGSNHERLQRAFTRANQLWWTAQ